MAASQNYPAELPSPVISAYSYGEIDHVRQNDVQSGPPRYELLNETTPGIFELVFSFNQAELSLFEGWYSTCILFGAIAFNIDLPVGAGAVSHEGNFPRSPNRTRNGKRWRVSVTFVSVGIVYGSASCP